MVGGPADFPQAGSPAPPAGFHWGLLADDLTCSAAMNETTLRKTADKMVELGLPALGYKYLVRPLPHPTCGC